MKKHKGQLGEEVKTPALGKLSGVTAGPASLKRGGVSRPGGRPSMRPVLLGS